MKLTNYLGVYNSLDAVWQSYPAGGVEGDYVLAGGKVYGWNIFERNWSSPDIAPSLSEVRKTKTFYGDVHVHHDLSVGGILRARVVRGRNAFCGLFASAAALEKHYPDPYIGQWALVAFDNRTDNDGNAIGKIYVCEQDGVWKDSGQKGGYDGTLYEALQTEREERMEMDEDLIVLISNEAKARQDADAVLQKNIDAEAKLREDADAKLQKNIEAEAKLRNDADKVLQGNIDKEVKARGDADATLQENINNEKKAREDADKDIQSNIEDLEKKHDEDIENLSMAIWPLEVSLSATPSVIEVNADTVVKLSWSAKRKGATVTPESQSLDGESVTGTTKSVTLQPKAEGTRDFTYTATYEKMTKSVKATVKAVYGTYFGSVAHDWEATEAHIKALGKSLRTSREATYTGIGTNNGKICYCYPASYGVLTSVKDGNGYEVLPSYTRSEVSINNQSYYCYLLTVPVTASGVTQIYK